MEPNINADQMITPPTPQTADSSSKTVLAFVSPQLAKWTTSVSNDTNPPDFKPDIAALPSGWRCGFPSRGEQTPLWHPAQPC